MNDERYISVRESLIDACKEVHEMRAGRLPKLTMEDFWKRRALSRMSSSISARKSI